jgi:hypothetical protein
MSAFALVLRSDWQPWLNAPPRVVRLAGLYRLRVGGPFGVESDLAIRIAKHAGYVATFVRGDSKEERIRKTIGTQQWKATGERMSRAEPVVETDSDQSDQSEAKGRTRWHVMGIWRSEKTTAITRRCWSLSESPDVLEICRMFFEAVGV